jgi:hypothetical protein
MLFNTHIMLLSSYEKANVILKYFNLKVTPELNFWCFLLQKFVTDLVGPL